MVALQRDKQAHCAPTGPPVLLWEASGATYINNDRRVPYLSDSFVNAQSRKLQRKLEPIWPVHGPWIELNIKSKPNWKPSGYNSYIGTVGGSLFEPTSAILS